MKARKSTRFEYNRRRMAVKIVRQTILQAALDGRVGEINIKRPIVFGVFDANNGTTHDIPAEFCYVTFKLLDRPKKNSKSRSRTWMS